MIGLKALLWPLRRPKPDRKTAAEAMSPAADFNHTVEQYDSTLPVVALRLEGIEIRYCTPNPFTKWRVETLLTKEPDTIAWIAGFGRDDVLVDIGANVGMYTILAAATRGTRVYAFEPESQNFAILNRNIVLNRLGDRVTAYCAALSDEPGFSLLHLSGFSTGLSGHTYGAEDLDHELKPRASPFQQGCVSTTLDRLVSDGAVPVPTHIKIDVDGIEHKVLAGCRETLRDTRLKTILIEINSNLEEHRRLVGELTALGFTFSVEEALAARRTAGPSMGTGNHVFRR